jgi:hypothetical protein
LKRLDEQARKLERRVSGPPLDELIEKERASSQAYGGMTVFGRAESDAFKVNKKRLVSRNRG